MVPKTYIWLILLMSTIYVLYSNIHYKNLDKHMKYYYQYIKTFFKQSYKIKNNEEILFTTSALKKYTNLNNGLYLSILGQVFDVTIGAKHYGPGATYHVFVGRDGSAAFITGDFTENGLTDDISSLTNRQIQSLMTWVEFYKKSYIYKGKLIGRFYNQNGAPTKEMYKLKKQIQIAAKNDLNEEQKKIKFPACNVEWNTGTGTKVWCTKNSGGVTRNWIGVPRMLFDDLKSKQFRCACIRLESQEVKDDQIIIKPYKGCAENATDCILGIIGT